MDSRTDQCQEHEIEVLSEWLESLKIIEEALENTIEYTNEILIALVLANIQNKQIELFKAWSQIQNSSMRTEQNSKTGKEKLYYSLRVIELPEQIIWSLQLLSTLEEA